VDGRQLVNKPSANASGPIELEDDR
jgi:hypothetical protein